MDTSLSYSKTIDTSLSYNKAMDTSLSYNKAMNMLRINYDNAIDILKNEIKCVERASSPIGACDRQCDKCDLLKTDTEIITALDMAIVLLENERKKLI